MTTISGFLLIAGMALQPQYAHADTLPAVFPIAEYATTTESIVRQVQAKYGLENDFYETAKCESSFDENAVGDHGQSRGTWQIHGPSWPSISPANAYDPHWSTEWAAQMFLAGKQEIWTCYRLLNDKPPQT